MDCPLMHKSYTKDNCFSVNGMAFRGRRTRLGLTQLELCQRSGYSERLIRKAEKGGKLRSETIRALATAMSVEGEMVSFEDLTIDLESTARRFVESYDLLGCGMVTACSDIFVDDFEFHCHGDSKQSFTGVWTGLAGFQEYLNRFFSVFTRTPKTLEPVYVVCDDHAIARYEDGVFYRGQEMPAFWVNLHFEFRDGKVIRIDDEFDSLKLARSFERLHCPE